MNFGQLGIRINFQYSIGNRKFVFRIIMQNEEKSLLLLILLITTCRSCILTMSRCSRFALFSKSSLTTSMWPSLAPEINAVQQSCAQRQPLTVRTPIRLKIQFDKRMSEIYLRWPRNGQSTQSTYQLIVPGAHGNTVLHRQTRVSESRVWRDKSM